MKHYSAEQTLEDNTTMKHVAVVVGVLIAVAIGLMVAVTIIT